MVQGLPRPDTGSRHPLPQALVLAAPSPGRLLTVPCQLLPPGTSEQHHWWLCCPGHIHATGSWEPGPPHRGKPISTPGTGRLGQHLRPWHGPPVTWGSAGRQSPVLNVKGGHSPGVAGSQRQEEGAACAGGRPPRSRREAIHGQEAGCGPAPTRQDWV